MTDRKNRLKKLVEVQEQLKALHETRRAGLLAEANAAGQEAEALADRFDAEGSLAGLFPELYHNRIAGALRRQGESLEKAHAEAAKVAAATARTNMVERAYKAARRDDERRRGDRERLEIIEQKRGR